MEEKKQVVIRKVTVTQFEGLHEGARVLGVHPNHLREVILGHRTSAKLRKRAEERGVVLPTVVGAA